MGLQSTLLVLAVLPFFTAAETVSQSISSEFR